MDILNTKRFRIQAFKTSRMLPMFVKGKGKLTHCFSILGVCVMVIDYYKSSGPQDTSYGNPLFKGRAN